MSLACHLVTTSDIEMEFNTESSDKRKYVVSTLEFSVNSDRDYG